MITQVEIARMLKLDVSTVNKILNRRPGTKFRPETVEKVLKVAKKNGYDFSRLKFVHRRKFDRHDVNLEAKLTVLLPDGTTFDAGRATVENISAGGARITDLQLRKAVLPTRPFRLVLEIKNSRIEARPTRLQSNGKLSLGVAFERPEPALLRKVLKQA